MSTIQEQVEKWYSGNLERLSKSASVKLRAEWRDPLRGAAEISVETPSLVGTITFWNKGDIAVLALLLPSKEHRSLDDRVLRPEESVPALLDRYFQELIDLSSKDDCS